MNSIETVKEIFREALKSVDPFSLVSGYRDNILSYYSLKSFSKLIIIGFGKAAWQMARAAEQMIDPSLISDGIIITKYGHTEKQGSGDRNQGTGGLKKIRVFEAAHPVPDENGLKATEELKKLLDYSDESTLVLCLVSGGGSALLVSPYKGISLSDKQQVTDLLLRAGAEISELNTVRKHLSSVKGGRLAKLAAPSEIISLMISDVIGDHTDVIASGPTSPDRSTYREAIKIIKKYDLEKSIPLAALEALNKGERGEIPETPKRDDPLFDRVQNIIIGSNKVAVNAALNKAESLDMNVEVLSSELTGEAREVACLLAKKAMELKRRNSESGNNKKCIISAGETTVTVKGSGKGGRNTELALAFAIEIEGIEGITLLSAGTDGTDGPTDAAGAVVDGKTVTVAKEAGLDPEGYLENNDSYNFFNKTGSLVITGPTGTNVMDLQIIIID